MSQEGQLGPSRMGSEEVITPLPAPWFGLRDDFPFGKASPGVATVFLDGRALSPSDLLFVALLTDLGADEFPSFVPFANLSSFL